MSGDVVNTGSSEGTCTLTATQAGDNNFFAAAPVAVNFAVFARSNIAAAQLALMATDHSWSVTPVDPGAGSSWNTSAGFNDSSWQFATSIYDMAKADGPPFFAQQIWTSGGQFSTTETTIWGRKVLTLIQLPTQAWLDFGVNDDADLYINGVRVVHDTNGVANSLSLDIAPYLHVGDNLFAFVARDNYLAYGYDHAIWMQVRSNVGAPISVPIPVWARVLLGVGLMASGSRMRRRR